MEYASGGELFDYINSQSVLDGSDDQHSRSLGGLREEETRQLFRQLVSAIRYLHEVYINKLCVTSCHHMGLHACQC